jgi:CBS domain containing-hemolysin-like protein
MASLGLGALGEPAFHDLLEPVLGDAATIAGFGVAAAVAFVIITTLHVVVGELAPKSLAIARTAPVVLALAPPMRAFYLSGEAPIRALAARLGFELEGHHETTVGGYLSEQLARVPDAGELVECHGHRFKVLAVDETRITELAVVGTTVQG